MARTTDSARHREVLDAAIKVVRERGIDGATNSEIAAAAGISKSSVFHYFGSRAELVGQIQERLYEIVREELETVAADASLSPPQRLRNLLHIHARHCVERITSPVLVAFIQRWGPPSTAEGHHHVLHRHRYEDVFESAFDDCVRYGYFRMSSSRVRTMGLIGMTTWLAMWYRPDEQPPLPEVVDDLLDMSLSGLWADPEAELPVNRKEPG